VVQAADFMCLGGACCRHSGTVSHVKGMRGEKFVRTSASGAELDKEVLGRWSCSAHKRASA
jgi:hypothetical protein